MALNAGAGTTDFALAVGSVAPIGTRTGAASTIMVGGENKEGDVLLKKANEDMAALVRSVAERRGRRLPLVRSEQRLPRLPAGAMQPREADERQWVRVLAKRANTRLGSRAIVAYQDHIASGFERTPGSLRHRAVGPRRRHRQVVAQNGPVEAEAAP